MAKMHKLTKGGQTIFPATIYDAVVNPKTRKNLTAELSELESIGTVNEDTLNYDNGVITLLSGHPCYIFLRNGKMIKYEPESDEHYDIANYGALVYDLSDNKIKAVVYNEIRSSHKVLLFRNSKEPNFLIGGQWYNSYLQRIIKDKREQLENKVAELQDVTFKFNKISTSGARTGRISSIDGSITAGNESLYVEFDVTEAKSVQFEASIYSGNFGYAFFKDETFLEGARTDATGVLIVIKPSGATKMRLSWNKAFVTRQAIITDPYSILSIDSLKNEINDFKKRIDRCDADITDINSNFFIKTDALLVYDNLVDLDRVELERYVRANGVEGSAFNWCRTDYIPVEEGQIYTAFDYVTTHVALYDSSRTIRTDVTWQSGESIPSGVAFIRLNQSFSSTTTAVKELVSLALIKGKATINPGFLPVLNSGKIRLPGEYVTFNDLKEYNARPFAGKGLFCAGDSQTTYGRYFGELLRVTGLKMIGNTGKMGNGGTSVQLPGFLKRMDSQGMIKWDEISVFTILVGGNDYGSNTEKGSFSDNPGANTIYGGIKGVIDYVLSKRSDIVIAVFTRPERDNVENIHNTSGYWFTTKILKGVTRIEYTGNVEPSRGCTDGGVAISGYNAEGDFVRNLLEAKGGSYNGEMITVPSDCAGVRICSKGSGAGEVFEFRLTTDGTDIENGLVLTEDTIDGYREKSSYVLPEGYLLNNSYYNIYIWENGYCDNRSYHYAPGPNLQGNTMYDIGEAICDCARRMGVPCLDTHNLCNVVHGYNLRKLMPDGTHFEQELASKIGRLMGNFINTLY